MKPFPTLLSLCLVCLAPAWCGAATSLDDLFLQLDALLQGHEQQVDRHADSLTLAAYTASFGNPKDEYLHNRMMLNAYSSFRYDSAYAYAEQNCRLAEGLATSSDSSACVEAAEDLLHILSVAGLFSEAEMEMHRLERYFLRHPATDSLYVRFLALANDLYLYKAEFSDVPYSQDYMRQAMNYRRLFIGCAPHDSWQYVFILATYKAETGQSEEAIRLLQELLETLRTGTREYSVVTGTLAYFYHFLNDTQTQKYYFACSAISDLQACITETNSLRALATILYGEGDIERAYRYLNTGVWDAQFYASRLRTFQTGQITPLIVRAWQQQQAYSRRLWRFLYAGALLFMLLLATGLVILIVLQRRINKAHKALEKKNREILHINNQLKEADKIKLEYISRFMRLASNYIIEFEKYRLQTYRMMLDGRTEEVAKRLRQTSVEQKNVSLFQQSFDTAFLNIYPSFISDVNRLLQDEAAICPKPGERLTTELRILALLRLGITDNQEIADILRSTISTIYTYRSRLRSKARNGATFEQEILLIGAFTE